MEHDEFALLAQEYLHNGLDPAARERLAAHLAAHPEALQEFVDQVQMHNSLFALHSGQQRGTELVRAVHNQLRYERESAVFSKAVLTRLNGVQKSHHRRLIVVAAAACVLLTIGLWGTFFPAPPAPFATVIQSGANVQLNRGNRLLTLTGGALIETGDQITTPTDTTVSFELADHTRVNLAAQSQLEVGQGGAGPRLALKTGTVNLAVAKRDRAQSLAVVTPHAVAEVVGTQFTVGVNGTATTLTVTEGRVRFTRTSDGRQVDVTAGESAQTMDTVFASHRTEPSSNPIKPSGRSMLFVVGKTELNAGDLAVVAHLHARGDEVRTCKLLELTPETVDRATLILISSTTRLNGEPLAKDLVHRLKYARASIVTWEPRLYPALGLTEKDQHGHDWAALPQGKELIITLPAHPVAAGLSGTIDVTNQPKQMAWGRVSEKASVIATFKDNPEKAAVFVFPRGVSLAEGSTASGARAGLFLFDDVGPHLNATGWTLFSRVCDWAWAEANTEQR